MQVGDGMEVGDGGWKVEMEDGGWQSEMQMDVGIVR